MIYVEAKRMIYYTEYFSKLGKLFLVSDGIFLTGVYFEGQRYIKKELFTGIKEDNLPIFKDTKEWLDKYFQGFNVDNRDLKIKLEVSDFQQNVYDVLKKIKKGEVMTYKEVASQVALKQKIKKMSAQAVGGAISHNPISIIIPCHRVIGSNGNLVGYAGGLWRKKKLLELEGLKIVGEKVQR